MALTRIKTDQITDLAVTNAKIANYTIQGGKLANNLTYGSSLTISGNLTVNGTTTTIDTTNTVASDPLIVLNRNAAGSNTYDIGLIFERGTSTNMAIIYDESADEFVMVSTSETGSTVGDIAITTYESLRLGQLNVDNININDNTIITTNANGNLDLDPNGTGTVNVKSPLYVEGNLTLDGNATIGNASGDSHTVNGSLTVTNGLSVTGGNNTLAGNLSVDGNVTLGNNVADGHIILGVVTHTGQYNIDNIRIDDNTISTINTNGDITFDLNGTGDVIIATGTELKVTDLTQTRVVFVGAAGALKDNANFTFDTATANLVINGQFNIDNLRLDSNTLSSTDTNGNIDITANGTGAVNIDNISIDQNTIASTNANGNINLTANGTGLVNIDNISIDQNTIATTNANGNLNLTPNGTGEVIAATLAVTDLTQNRVVYVGANDALVDSANLTFDGTNLTIAGQFNLDNIRIDNNTISSTNSNGNINLDPNGTGVTNVASDVYITGNLYVTGTETVFNVISSSTEDPVLHLGGPHTESALTSNDGMDRGIEFHYYDTSDKHGFFGWDNSAGEYQFLLDVTETSLNVYSGTYATGHFGGLKVDSLTTNRVVYVGASDALVDSANLTFDGTTLTLVGQFNADNIRIDANTISSTNTNGNIDITANGTGVVNIDNISIDQNTIASTNANGNLNLTPNGTGEVVAATLAITDLTQGRVPYVGVNDTIIDSSNFTFDGSIMGITATVNVTGQFNADNIRIDDNTISSTNTNGNIDITANGTGKVNIDNISIDQNTIATTNVNGDLTLDPNGTGDVIIASGSELKVTDLTQTRVVFVGASGALTDNANFTYTSGTGKLTVVGSAEIDNVSIDGNTITNIDSNGNLTITGNGSGSVIIDNVVITSNDITSNTSELVINEAGADINFRVEGDTQTHLLYVDAGLNNIGVRTSSPNAESILHINGTSSIILPVGTTAERPQTPVAGMARFNSATNGFEIYDGNEWAGFSTTFTIATSETFTGDGSTVAYTLSAESSTAACLVSINGVIQIPVTAYGVSSDTLTFTEAPEAGDVVEVRILLTTVYVNRIASADLAERIVVEENIGEMNFFENSIERMSLDAGRLNFKNGTKLTYNQTAVSVGTSAVAVDTFSASSFRSAKYIVQVTNGGEYETSEVLVVHDGTTANRTEYAVVNCGTALGSTSVDINSGNVRLMYTGNSAGNTVKVFATYIV